MERTKRYALYAVLLPADMFLRFLNNHYELFRWFIVHVPGWVFEHWGRLNFRRAFLHAKATVPAYQMFLSDSQSSGSGGSEFDVPAIDKENYVRVFDTATRAVDGRIPFRDTVVDESSGSSGAAYNWVRSLEERQVSHRLVSHFAHYCLGTSNVFSINAFSMGAWATGLNMGLALQHNGLVKNVGPDIDKILGTLEFWGPDYTYVICGYPPFLKHLLDVAVQQRFPIDRYRLHAIVGGEGMSEGLRDYLLRHVKTVFSGYGATDLEIGIAGETPLSIAIRRAARDNPALREQLFGANPRLPMLFQFNPVTHYIQTNADGEIIVTINRLNILSPRVRYNIHDEGGVRSFAEVSAICAEYAPDYKTIFDDSKSLPKLPFLWVFGRKDYTISVMGANIYPEDIEQCIYADDQLASRTASYCLGLLETNGSVRPEFSFEVDGEITVDLIDRFETSIVQHLLNLNSDFKEAWHEYRETVSPKISLYQRGQGPFAYDSQRIKQVRMMPR